MLRTPRPVALIVVAAFAVGIASYAFYRFGHNTPAISEPLPAGLSLNGLDGQPHKFEEWHGKLLLVNFWATWCTPCLHEIPQLVKTQQQFAARGLQIVGPAVDDPDAVRSMQGPLGIDYPILTGTQDAMIELMEKLGNSAGGLPFSVLVSADGTIIQRQIGEFTPSQLNNLVEAHLPAAAQ